MVTSNRKVRKLMEEHGKTGVATASANGMTRCLRPLPWMRKLCPWGSMSLTVRRW
jgi:hypothetical protein